MSDSTSYHLAYRDIGGSWIGDGWAPEIRIHITRLLGQVRDSLQEDPQRVTFRQDGGARAWLYSQTDELPDRFWLTWLYVEHHEFLHALMHRWKEKYWSSEEWIVAGSMMLIGAYIGLRGVSGPLNTRDVRIR